MQGVRLLGIGTQIFLQNLAGGTFIRVGMLIRHCIVDSISLGQLLAIFQNNSLATGYSKMRDKQPFFGSAII